MTKPHQPAYASLAELIHSLGSRLTTAKELGINKRTLTRRMEEPDTFTLAEMKRLAKLASTDLRTIIRLAEQQLINHIEPPAAELGRPPGT